MTADDGPVQQGGFGEGSGALIANDEGRLRRKLARVVRFVGQLLIFNALAMLTLGRSPGARTPQLPGIALLVVGGLLMVSLLEVLLEAVRPALAQGLSLPRSRLWVVSRKALLAAAFGIAGALPTAMHLARSLPSSSAALPPLSYGAVCVCLLAFFHAAFCIRRVNANAPASVVQRLLRLAQLAAIAAILQTGFGALSQPEILAPYFTLAVAFAFAFWHALPERTASAPVSNASRARALTATYALGTLLVLAFVRAFVVTVCVRAGASTANATALGFIISGVGVLAMSLFGLWIREVPALAEQLGFGPGKGVSVILREALFWSIPAVLFNQAYWATVGQHVAGAIHSGSAPTATMTALTGSPLALIAVGLIAAPVLEEVLFRGMLYRVLRTRWALAPSLLLSSVVFLTDHTPAGAIPVFVGSVCITLAFERSRSIYAAMLTHALCNGVLVVQMLAR